MSALDLTTYANVKAYMVLASDKDQALISTLITSVSSAFMGYLGRNPLSQNFVGIYDGTGTPRLYLKNSPISAVSSVLMNSVSIPASVNQSSGYVFSRNALSLLGNASNLPGYYQGWPVPSTWQRGYSNIQVSYTAGYLTADPQYLAIQQCANEAVANAYKLKDRIGLKSEGAISQTTSYNQDFLQPATKLVLDQYKTVVSVNSFGD